jgi:hypothetical protein
MFASLTFGPSTMPRCPALHPQSWASCVHRAETASWFWREASLPTIRCPDSLSAGYQHVLECKADWRGVPALTWSVLTSGVNSSIILVWSSTSEVQYQRHMNRIGFTKPIRQIPARQTWRLQTIQAKRKDILPSLPNNQVRGSTPAAGNLLLRPCRPMVVAFSSQGCV